MLIKTIVLSLGLLLGSKLVSAQEVNKEQVKLMIEQFKSAGLFDEKQTDEALKRLDNLSDNEMNTINEKARGLASEMGSKGKMAVSNDLGSAVQNVNMNDPEFKKLIGEIKSSIRTLDQLD